jgi:hypothetical protein
MPVVAWGVLPLLGALRNFPSSKLQSFSVSIFGRPQKWSKSRPSLGGRRRTTFCPAPPFPRHWVNWVECKIFATKRKWQTDKCWNKWERRDSERAGGSGYENEKELDRTRDERRQRLLKDVIEGWCVGKRGRGTLRLGMLDNSKINSMVR